MQKPTITLDQYVNNENSNVQLRNLEQRVKHAQLYKNQFNSAKGITIHLFTFNIFQKRRFVINEYAMSLFVCNVETQPHVTNKRIYFYSQQL